MAKIHLKKCSLTLAVKKMQIRTILRLYLTQVQHSEDQMLERMWERGNPHLLLVGVQTGSHSESQFGESSKTKTEYSI